MSTPIIEVSNLTRSFDEIQAVQKISFSVNSGDVVGFIGANGAGKTTTMRMMVTLDLPDSGTIKIAGIPVVDSPYRVRQIIGWMPDYFGKYKNMSVFEYLDFYARAFEFKGSERGKRIREVMDFTDLGDLRDRYIDQLSKGMGQRLCLGRTLLHDPKVLILDEPAAGLDPKARIELRNLLRLLAEDGKTIFISSHILSELGELCDSMLFIDKGKIIHHGSAKDLKKHDGTLLYYTVRVASKIEKLEEWVSLNPDIDIEDVLSDGARIVFTNDDPDFVSLSLKRMIAADNHVVEFRKEERKLEDAFVDILNKINEKTNDEESG